MKVFANGTVELVTQDRCNLDSKPTTSQNCHIANCDAKWHFTKWSTVSKVHFKGVFEWKKHLLIIKKLHNTQIVLFKKFENILL